MAAAMLPYSAATCSNVPPCSRKRTATALTAIELRVGSIHQVRFGVNHSGQILHPPAQYSRHVESGVCSSPQKYVDTGAQPFAIARVSRDEIIQRRPRLGMPPIWYP